MNSARNGIDKWLLESDLITDEQALSEVWEPIFEVGRQLVYIKIGPYWRLFIRPQGFVKRFYHRIYHLPVQNLRISRQLILYDGFCTIDVDLNIRFQATLKYALSNMDILPDLNEHIKTAYEDLLINLIDKKLLALSDGAWVQKGVYELEKSIAFTVNELLIMQNIQSQVLCSLKPSFEDFPEVKLPKENVYLCVLKKSFEFNNAKREEIFTQDQELEQQKLAHNQSRLEQLKRDAELEREQQAQEALNKMRLLEEKEQQLQQLFEIEQRLHAGQVEHENNLKQITLEAELLGQQKHEARLRIAEQQTQLDSLAHQAKLQAQELEAEIARHEYQLARWRESNHKTQTQQIAFEQRQKQPESEADLENRK